MQNLLPPPVIPRIDISSSGSNLRSGNYRLQHGGGTSCSRGRCCCLGSPALPSTLHAARHNALWSSLLPVLPMPMHKIGVWLLIFEFFCLVLYSWKRLFPVFDNIFSCPCIIEFVWNILLQKTTIKQILLLRFWCGGSCNINPSAGQH